MIERALIAVIDDHESVRESLHQLLREIGFAVRSFASANEFLIAGCIGEVDCLLTDIDMPGMSGCDLQQELQRRGENVPIVFISAHADDLLRSRVLEQGAIACLCKPFNDIVLLEAIRTALDGVTRGDRSDTGE
jgi:FixJ family two-component response regulator